MLIGAEANAQHEDLQQRMDAFAEAQKEKFEKRYLNVKKKDLGGIDQAPNAFNSFYELKSHERMDDLLGNSSYFEYYLEVFAYDSEADRDWALKTWFKSFLEGKSIRPGRPVRTYPFGKPTLVLINGTDVIIFTFKCSQFNEDSFKTWKKELLKFFGNDDTIVLELQCEGPLEWTKNAPDPKDRKW